MRRLHWVLPVVVVVLVAGFLLARSPGGGELLRSDKRHDTSPEVAAADIEQLIAGNTAFALDLYHTLGRKDGNLFFSPHSISIALAMTYAGARGETERQMADTLHFTLPQERLHPAFNALGLELARRHRRGFELHIVNAAWGQSGYPFLPDFLDTLAVNYDAGLRLLDFAGAPKRSREIVNHWVRRQTKGMIRDLLPQDAVGGALLLLTNAIYFDAEWKHEFDPQDTHDGPFTLLDGDVARASMMHRRAVFGYAEGEGWQAAELPYRGGEFSMVVLLPREGQFRAFEQALDIETLGAILRRLRSGEIGLAMPKLDYRSAFGLKGALSTLGMPDAFTGRADLSGMDGRGGLWVTDVFHQAAVRVNERGTRAAAGTAVEVAGMPVSEVTIDRPFIFLIRDVKTGAILFLGRVLDPRG